MNDDTATCGQDAVTLIVHVTLIKRAALPVRCRQTRTRRFDKALPFFTSDISVKTLSGFSIARQTTKALNKPTWRTSKTKWPLSTPPTSATNASPPSTSNTPSGSSTSTIHDGLVDSIPSHQEGSTRRKSQAGLLPLPNTTCSSTDLRTYPAPQS